MADITKCLTKDCPLASNCFRQTANDGFRQSYAEFRFEMDNGDVDNKPYVACEHFILATTRKKF